MSGLRHIAVIAGNSLRRSALDPAGLFWLVALPVLLIWLLGTLLQNVMAGNFSLSQPFTVAVAGSGSPGYDEIVQGLTGVSDFLTVSQAADADSARRAVWERASDAAVIVPAEFPFEPLTIVAVPGSIVGAVVGEIVFDVANGVAENAAGLAPLPEWTVHEVEVATDRDVRPWQFASSFQYYSVAMAVYFALFGALQGLQSYVADRKAGTYARVRVAGIPRATYLAGTLTATVVMAAGMLAVIALAAWLLFGIAWGHLGAWVVLTVLGSVTAVAMVFLLLALLPKPDSLEGIANAIFPILAFLGGSFMPLPAMPEGFLPTWLVEASLWLPNRLMLEGYFVLMMDGGGLADISSELTRLAGIALVLLVAAWSIAAIRDKGEA